jgi:hypothetical protein
LRFKSLEVKGVCNIGDDDCMIVHDDADAHFFSLYGRDENGLAHCIGDFNTRESAEFIKAALE